MEKNIYKNYIFTLLQNVDFTRGIWMIYLASKGMSLTELGLLETIFHITSFLLEVPTGAIADIFGRKTSRILGRISSLVSVIILLLANNFIWFAISFMFTALSYNLESGAGDALIYDSLRQIGQEERYLKVSGLKEVFYQTSGIISFLAGGFLATMSYFTAFSLTILVDALAIIQAFTFKEPTIGKVSTEIQNENPFVNQLKTSFKEIKSNKRLGFLIIFSQSISAFSTCIFFYLQNYLKGIGYNEAKIGVIYAISSFTVAIVAAQINRIEKKLKEQGILIAVPYITVLCIWGVALSRISYVFFILLMITESIVFVSIDNYINKMIPSENRATILSFASMVFSFLMITFFPMIGYLGDRYSLKFSFVVLAVTGSIFVIINSLILIKRVKR